MYYLQRFMGPENAVMEINVIRHNLPVNTIVRFRAGSEASGDTIATYLSLGAITPYNSHYFYSLDNAAFILIEADGNNDANIVMEFEVTALAAPGILYIFLYV